MTKMKLSTILTILIGAFALFPIGCAEDLVDDQGQTDADTDGDSDGDSDSDTDSDADGPGGQPVPDFTDEELAKHRDYNWDQFCGNEEFDAIDPSWLTHPYAGTWPDPDLPSIQMGNCFPTYNSNFWNELACYNAQEAQIDPIGDGAVYNCPQRALDDPPTGTPFSCSSYRCRFCERLTQDESLVYFPDICTEEDAKWECTSCYYELMTCLWDASITGECEIDNQPKMYKVQPALRDCYMKVTGFDRCRWVLPDVCEDVVECSGPEWPPV